MDPYSSPYASGLNVNNPTYTSHILLMSNVIYPPSLCPDEAYLGVVIIREKYPSL